MLLIRRSLVRAQVEEPDTNRIGTSPVSTKTAAQGFFFYNNPSRCKGRCKTISSARDSCSRPAFPDS